MVATAAVGRVKALDVGSHFFLDHDVQRHILLAEQHMEDNNHKPRNVQRNFLQLS